MAASTHIARAKINLTLHVGALRADGYHPVESLVVFADVGDSLAISPSAQTYLRIDGAPELPTGADNIILQTMDRIAAPPHDIHLTKNLPISAGIGGGSANAAAILRAFDSQLSDETLAFELGADVPVCRLSRTAHMSGVGEGVTPQPGLGQISAVLVNPGVAVSTAAIFRAFDAVPRDAAPQPLSQTGDLLARALAGTNDLQDVAMAQAPLIGDALRALAQQPACTLARMSGSGATCFGLFRSEAQAQAAAAALSAQHPGWWVQACVLGEAG